MAKPGLGPTYRYSSDFKAEAVRLSLQSGATVQDVVVTKNNLRRSVPTRIATRDAKLASRLRLHRIDCQRHLAGIVVNRL